ncbi:MAG: hypothetical protein PWQ92_1580 [Thermococcaceae archaeon]|nr:hypothetical protein [Thermococcaceae archaeon]
MEIETDSGTKLKGRIISVSSGRVRVDFNHPYAGKTVIYEVEILEKIDDPIEKVKALIELRIPRIDFEKVQIEVGENDVKIDFGEQAIDPRTLVLGEILLESDLKFLGYEKIEFKPSVEELLKPPEAKMEEEIEEAEAKEEVEEKTEEKAEETKEETEETTETVKEEKAEKQEKKTTKRRTRRTSKGRKKKNE